MCVLTNLLRQLSDLILIKYISNVVHHRGGPDVYDINDINDTRNGLLLSSLLHHPFGAGKIAFLKVCCYFHPGYCILKLKYSQTPNFGLTVDDIPYNQPKAADEEGPASRLTLHHIVDLPRLGRLIPGIAPHNSDARQPQDTTQWPPAVIVDLVYAAAAMNAWSPKSFIKYVREQSSDAYYPEGRRQEDEHNDNVSDSSGSSYVNAQTGDQTAGQSGTGRYALRSRNRTSNVPAEERSFPDLMDGVFALWMQSSRTGKKKTEDFQASSLSHNEGVEKWLESMEDPETN